MAAANVAPPGWKKVKRDGRSARFHPRITIRPSGDIGLSVDFALTARLDQFERASVFVSDDGLRLGMKFHSDGADDDSFLLCKDGGSGMRQSNNLVIQCGLISKHELVRALARESAAVRRFEPKRSANGLWVVDLIPCFEKELGLYEKSPVGSGIYRYRLGEDTVYIGRGVFRDRLSANERNGWQFERIQYSVINDEETERNHETFWLNEYRNRNHRWPVYNRIGGVNVAPATRERASG